jgi:hypothetical protein
MLVAYEAGPPLTLPTADWGLNMSMAAALAEVCR